MGNFNISTLNLRYGGKLIIDNQDENIPMIVTAALVELKYNSNIFVKRKIKFTVGDIDLEPMSSIELEASGYLLNINFKLSFMFSTKTL